MITHDVDGRLEPVGERWQLRFSRRLAHPPAKVWRALTEPDEMAAWFPTQMLGSREVAASLKFVHPFPDAPTLEGEILVYDPPSTLAFTWGNDTLRFELAPDGDGCLLTFLDTFDALGKAARDAAGWHTCLDQLGYLLDNRALHGQRPLERSPPRLPGPLRPGGVDHWSPRLARAGPLSGRRPRHPVPTATTPGVRESSSLLGSPPLRSAAAKRVRPHAGNRRPRATRPSRALRDAPARPGRRSHARRRAPRPRRSGRCAPVPHFVY